MRRGPLRLERFLVAAVLAVAPAAGARAQESGPTDLSDTRAATPAATVAVSARALIVATHSATLAAGIEGQVLEIPLRPGDSFSQSDLLVEMDCTAERARLAAANANLAGARARTAVERRMVELRSSGRHDLDLARAEQQRAEAEVALLADQVDRCRIVAPYVGQVVALHVSPYERVGRGAPLLDIVDDDSLELEILVPAAWLRWLKPGTAFTLAVEAVGERVDAEVTRVGAVVDPASQSLRVFGRFTESPAPAIRPGMSGEARFGPPRP